MFEFFIWIGNRQRRRDNGPRLESDYELALRISISVCTTKCVGLCVCLHMHVAEILKPIKRQQH